MQNHFMTIVRFFKFFQRCLVVAPLLEKANHTQSNIRSAPAT